MKNQAVYANFNKEMAKHPGNKLSFKDSEGDRVSAYFHTGGTTGMPKVAQHKYSGMIYNGWVGHTLLFRETDNIMCPLPLFHVFACHVIVMSMIASGAQGIFPTPAGYRGDGVFDKFLETDRALAGVIYHNCANGTLGLDAASGRGRCFFGPDCFFWLGTIAR